LLSLQPDEGYSEARWAAKMDSVLELHAHELAEKIREQGNAAMESADADAGRTTPSDPKYNTAAALFGAASLIDPEVE
jgi:hypothetical protein